MEAAAIVLGPVPIALESLNRINTVLHSESPDNFLVLSFHAEQAVRIRELQSTLICLFEEKEKAKRQRAPTPAERQTSPTLAGTETETPPTPVEEATRDVETINQEIDGRLHIYADALRDYETLSREAEPDQLFYASLASLMFDYFFAYFFDRAKYQRRRALNKVRKDLNIDLDRWKSDRYYLELNQELRLAKEKRNAYLERLWMGTFGGVALIGPMILMSLRQDLNTSLITASVATLIFTVVLAIAGRTLGGKDVLAATAAYAAVLVVFVGTSLAAPTTSN